MSEDIRMSDVFNLPISCEEVSEIGTEIFLGNEDAYAAYAINQHDKLTDRVKELEAFVELVARAKIEREEIDAPYVGVCEIVFISSIYKDKAKELLK